MRSYGYPCLSHEAIQHGATDPDIIVLKTIENSSSKKPVRNALDLASRVFSFMLYQIVPDDLIFGRLEGKNNRIKLNFYYPEEEVTTNSLIFDPEQMKRWWDYGHLIGQKNKPECRVIHNA